MKTYVCHKMEARQFCQRSFFLAWIFVFFCPSVSLDLEELKGPRITLENTVFVAFAGEDLLVHGSLKIPANQISDILVCTDPFHKQIYNCVISETHDSALKQNITVQLKGLRSSGEYACRYKNTEAFLVLHVRSAGYQDHAVLDYSEFIAVALISGALLIFSTAGSAFVLREYWKEHSKKEKQSKQEKGDTQTTQDRADVISSPSTSFYASLEPRPRSIYDVLDRSATSTEPDKSGAKPNNKAPKNKVVQAVQTQQVDESVYENF